MTKAAGKTAPGPTVTVAIEQHFPPDLRILEDGLAASLLPFAMRATVWATRPAFVRDWMVRALDRDAPGIYGGVLCRKRYIDERLVASVGTVEAVVNLGAGWDTRLYRLPELADLPAWEVDLPQNIAAKRARLATLFGEAPAHVTLVPMDFDREDLGEVLASHGWPMAAPTFFVWEAVTQYLTEASARKTLEFLARAAPGSRLAFTYILGDFVRGQAMHGQEKLYKQYVEKGVWTYGMDPEAMEDLLGDYGWRLVEHPTYEALTERYVAPTGRNLATTDLERMVYAERSPGAA